MLTHPLALCNDRCRAPQSTRAGHLSAALTAVRKAGWTVSLGEAQLPPELTTVGRSLPSCLAPFLCHQAVWPALQTACPGNPLTRSLSKVSTVTLSKGDTSHEPENCMWSCFGAPERRVQGPRFRGPARQALGRSRVTHTATWLGLIHRQQSGWTPQAAGWPCSWAPQSPGV